MAPEDRRGLAPSAGALLTRIRGALPDVDPATASIASRLTAPWVDRVAMGPKSRLEPRDGLDALAPSRERSFPEVAGSIGDGAML